MTLEEGRTYIFDALKTIELPGGGTNLVLAGPDSKKYLLPLEFYKGYNLSAPGRVRCRVDKINCSGKVFLEPEHPVCREGLSYDFEVISILEFHDEKGVLHESVTVADPLGNLVIAPREMINTRPVRGDKIRLRIDRISKGKLRFGLKSGTDKLIRLEEDKSYEFTIARIVAGPDGDRYFVALDSFGDEHLLAVRYYSHYGFDSGTLFRGKVARYSSGGRKTIEPENPWFKPDDILKVKLVSYIFLETGEGFLAEVRDSKGLSHTLILGEQPGGNELTCRVIKIRKGKPVLERIED